PGAKRNQASSATCRPHPEYRPYQNISVPPLSLSSYPVVSILPCHVEPTCQFDHLNSLYNIMATYDTDTFEGRPERGAQAACDARIHVLCSIQVGKHGFSRHAHEYGATFDTQLVNRAQQSQIMLQIL